jgi:hypothetical protein
MFCRRCLSAIALTVVTAFAQNIDTTYKRCAPAVVLLLAEKEGTALGQGSGV